MSLFQPNEQIFADEYPLRENYQPDRLQERDEEIDQYKRALQPVINNAPPKNIFLYGKTGVGKTVATNYLLDHLQEDAKEYEVDLTVVKQPCNSLSSSYQVAVNLINQLRPPDDQVPSTGYPQQDIFQMLYDELEKIGGTVLIVLDEIDNVGSDDDILYELPRAEANGYLEGVWPGIIGISNDFTFRDNLSPKVKDTLCEEEIQFPPYNANELRTIISARADKAFHDSVVSEDVVPYVSALAAQDSGSARQGLRLLYKAGELARDNNDEKVREGHVEAAQSILERGQIQEGMRDLTAQGHLVLCAVTALGVRESTPARTQEVYDQYRQFAAEIESNVLGERRIRDHLSELSLHGFLSVQDQNDGIHGGSYHEYELNVQLDAVLDVLSEVARLEEVPDALRQRARQKDLL